VSSRRVSREVWLQVVARCGGTVGGEIQGRGRSEMEQTQARVGQVSGYRRLIAPFRASPVAAGRIGRDVGGVAGTGTPAVGDLVGEGAV